MDTVDVSDSVIDLTTSEPRSTLTSSAKMSLSDIVAATITCDTSTCDSSDDSHNFSDLIRFEDNEEKSVIAKDECELPVKRIEKIHHVNPVIVISPLQQTGLQATQSKVPVHSASSSQPQDLSTPVTRRTISLAASNDSPGGENRLDDSLSFILGSPQGESPLAHHPYFTELQATLESDCKKNAIPQSLLSISTTPDSDSDVYTRERTLQTKFNMLQNSCPEDIQQLSTFYRYQTALVETERFRSLHEYQYSLGYKDHLNSYYDNQLLKIMDRVEKSVSLLEEAHNEPGTLNRIFKPRPLLSKKAIRVMEDWYQLNLEHPYPNAVTVETLAQAGGINGDQVKKWFANKRNRSNNTRTLTEIAKKKRKIALGLDN